MLLNRIGYGSNFNSIIIEDNIVIKQSKNEYGNAKLKTEISFYKHLLDNNIAFEVPNIFLLDEENYTIKMQFLSGYVELYKFYSKCSKEEKTKILDKIFSTLHKLHANRITVSKQQYYSDLILETKEKIQTRMEIVKNIIDKYSFIKKVNCFEIKNLDDIKSKIFLNVNNYFKTLDEYTYSIIHGDCQFNNILLNENYDIKFIDPRGYFGNTKIYGIKEYDTAKIYFALTGYDSFDNSFFENVNIENDNIDIFIDFQIDELLLYDSPFITSLLISIWLGNSHIFIHDEYKCITSYFIAMFLGSKYLF
jgi:tRNA A-37 threonylcarbamoyl transferase component Bud32